MLTQNLKKIGKTLRLLEYVREYSYSSYTYTTKQVYLNDFHC